MEQPSGSHNHQFNLPHYIREGMVLEPVFSALCSGNHVFLAVMKAADIGGSLMVFDCERIHLCARCTRDGNALQVYRHHVTRLDEAHAVMTPNRELFLRLFGDEYCVGCSERRWRKPPPPTKAPYNYVQENEQLRFRRVHCKKARRVGR